MLPEPAIMLLPASKPRTVFSAPVLAVSIVTAPMAVLWSPVMPDPAPSPMAVFHTPSTLLKSASQPKALLNRPKPAAEASLLSSALVPTAVLFPPSRFSQSARSPTPVLLLAVEGEVAVKSLNTSAWVPTAVFVVAVMLSNNASMPTAVLLSPALMSSDPAPTAVLKLPVPLTPLNPKENHPIAVLNTPTLSLPSALNPSAVLPLPTSIACAPDKSPKQANTDRIVVNILRRFFISLIFFFCLIVLAFSDFSLENSFPAVTRVLPKMQMGVKKKKLNFFLRGKEQSTRITRMAPLTPLPFSRGEAGKGRNQPSLELDQ